MTCTEGRSSQVVLFALRFVALFSKSGGDDLCEPGGGILTQRFQWPPLKNDSNRKKHKVSFVERGDVIRIISARKVTRRELHEFEEEN